LGGTAPAAQLAKIRPMRVSSSGDMRRQRVLETQPPAPTIDCTPFVFVRLLTAKKVKFMATFSSRLVDRMSYQQGARADGGKTRVEAADIA